MAIKEMSTYQERRFQYESPDGETYDVKIAVTADRKYIQFCPAGRSEETVTLDGPMLADMFYVYQDCTSERPTPSLMKKRNLQAPRVIDHRQGTEHSHVKEIEPMPAPTMDSMEVDPELLPEVGETPEEWRLNKDKDQLTGWQQEAIERKSRPKPAYKQRGSAGSGFQRMGASELI